MEVSYRGIPTTKAQNNIIPMKRRFRLHNYVIWNDLLFCISVIAICAILFPLSSFVSAADQKGTFTIKSVPVISKADAFVAEANGKQFPVGATLKLTVRNTQTARKLRESDFQVRLFSVPRFNVEPEPWEFFDPCYVYLSTVFQFRGSNVDSINFGDTDEAWVKLLPGGVVHEGKFLLVFEQMKDNNDIIRLHKDHKKEYFNSGLYIEIVPVRDYPRSELDELSGNVEKYRNQLASEIKTNSPSRPCYRYKMIIADADNSEMEFASLDLCEGIEGRN